MTPWEIIAVTAVAILGLLALRRPILQNRLHRDWSDDEPAPDDRSPGIGGFPYFTDRRGPATSQSFERMLNEERPRDY